MKTNTKRPPQHFEIWEAYFDYNRENLHAIDWEDQTLLSQQAHDAIRASIQQFQRGESSDAVWFIQKAKQSKFGKQDRSYPRALQAFINEEHRHAADLKRFMQKQNIPTIKGHWVDNCFRILRKAVSLTGTHITLTTAEIIAAVYYPALRDATNSKILKQLCTQIIQDEDQHLAFQAAVIKKMQAAQPYWLTRIGGVGWRLFLALTTAVVWLDHKKVFKAAGVSYAKFWKESFMVYRRVRDQIRSPFVLPEIQVKLPINQWS